MENLVMRENHPLAIYGEIFVIAMNAKKNQLIMMINQEEERKKSSQQSLKERYEAGDPEVDLLGEPSRKFDYYVFYPTTKKQKLQLPSYKETKPKQDTNHEPKPPLIPYYQNILSQIHKYHLAPSTKTFTLLHI